MAARAAEQLATETDDAIGPTCPRCSYNLTGLPEPRCPECGTAFSWEAVWREARFPPRIAFERACGVRKAPWLFVTALTVLFAPWRFADQAVRRVRTGHASLFGALCFASIFISLFWMADLAFVLAWLLTALIYLPLQTVLLAALDRRSWQRPAGAAPWLAWAVSAHFWLLIGCYTSAVMMTEFRYGPPLLTLSDLLAVLRWERPGSLLNDLFHDWSWPTALLWAQLLLWLAALGCCHAARARQPGGLPAVRWGVALAATVAVLFLYAAVIEHVGLPIGEWLFEWLN